MWLVGLAVLLAACGRIGFGESIADGQGGAEGFRALCAATQVRTIKDGIFVDDNAGDAATTTIYQACAYASPPPLDVVSQDDPGVLAADGRPLLMPAMTAIIAGGDGPQRAIAYALDHDAPVIWDDADPVTITERATSGVIVSGPISSTHDYLVVQTFLEPISGGRVVSVAGDVAEGTTAAKVWFQLRLETLLATESRSWFVIEWTDDDGTAGGTAGDTFAVIASGP